MAIEKLTATFCQLAYCEPEKRRTDHYDSEIKGLVLSCYPSGSKSFSLRFIDEYGKQKGDEAGILW